MNCNQLHKILLGQYGNSDTLKTIVIRISLSDQLPLKSSQKLYLKRKHFSVHDFMKTLLQKTCVHSCPSWKVLRGIKKQHELRGFSRHSS